jgi:UbiA prenyltransferase family
MPHNSGQKLTVTIDTIYACQDKKDDVNVGIKSTAVLFDQYTRQILALFGATILGCFAMAGYLSQLHWAYYAVTIVGAFTHLVWQLKTVDLDNPKSCWKMVSRSAMSCSGLPLIQLMIVRCQRLLLWFRCLLWPIGRVPVFCLRLVIER